MSISNLGALVVAKPDEAKAQILEKVEEAKGDRKLAAKLLGTTHRSLYRFVERLHLWPTIDQLARDKGFAPHPGPPRSVDKIMSALLLARGDLANAARALEVSPTQLRARILELDIHTEINHTLKAAQCPALPPFKAA